MSESVALPAATTMPARRRRPFAWGPVVRHLVLALFAVVTLFPIAWVLLLSIKSVPDANQNEIWPRTFDFSHYGFVLEKVSTLPQNYANSLMVTFGTVVIATICAVLAGYALVFLDVPGKALVVAVLVASLFFPTRLTAIIAIYETQKDLGMLNVPAGLIFPYVSLSVALSVFIMRGVFQTVSREIYDAARIDGAGPLRMLLQILLPLVTNGIIVVIIINFGAAWGEYLLSKTLNTRPLAQTLPVVLATGLGGRGGWSIPKAAAVYVLAITPGLLAFAIAQRWYMKGLQEGALKA